MEYAVPAVFAVFGMIFIALIFVRSFLDSKKEKARMTEIFRKYGVKTDAKILRFQENKAYGKHGIEGRYNYLISFAYTGIRNETVTCTYTLPTNHPGSRQYTDSIPIIYIPAYVDYYMQRISREDFFRSVGHELRLGNGCWLVIFSEDLGLFTDLTEI